MTVGMAATLNAATRRRLINFDRRVGLIIGLESRWLIRIAGVTVADVALHAFAEAWTSIPGTVGDREESSS